MTLDFPGKHYASLIQNKMVWIIFQSQWVQQTTQFKSSAIPSEKHSQINISIFTHCVNMMKTRRLTQNLLSWAAYALTLWGWVTIAILCHVLFSGYHTCLFLVCNCHWSVAYLCNSMHAVIWTGIGNFVPISVGWNSGSNGCLVRSYQKRSLKTQYRIGEGSKYNVVSTMVCFPCQYHHKSSANYAHYIGKESGLKIYPNFTG